MTIALRPLRALFLGAPGAGKGTQTSRLVRDFPQLSAISSGDLLRNEIEKGSEAGKKAAQYIEKGELIPDADIISLITTELQSRSWLNDSSSWLLDGFPRTVTQAPPLDKVLSSSGCGLNLVVQLKVPEEVILDRIENRWVHLPSGRVYNLTFNPPKEPGKDDLTGEPLSKRPDDNPKVFKERLDKYNALTMPLVDYYKAQGILHAFEGETSDIIYPKIKAFLESEFK